MNPIVDRTMRALCDALQERAAGVESVYVYGSVALGDYIEGSSDIDFIATLRQPPDAAMIQAISDAHQFVESAFPGTDMMGAYVQPADLGKPIRTDGSVVTYFNRQLHTDGKGADLNPVTWWILKRHGIHVHGPALSLRYEDNPEVLRRYVIGNMNTYWLGWIDRLEKLLEAEAIIYSEEQQNEAVEWCVLGMLRQLYTLKEHDITSKCRAGQYGIRTLPERWHGLIDEAIRIKRREPITSHRPYKERLQELVALLRYIHKVANELN